MRGNGCCRDDCEYLRKGIFCDSPKDTVDKYGQPICPLHRDAIKREDYDPKNEYDHYFTGIS